MSILLVLIPLTLVLVIVAAAAFCWAVESGQFDDLDRASWDMLSDDDAVSTPKQAS